MKLANQFGRNSEEYRRAWGIGAENSVPEYLARVSRYCIEHGAPDLVETPFAERVYAWRGEVLEAEIGGLTCIVRSGRGAFELDDVARFICEQVDGNAPPDRSEHRPKMGCCRFARCFSTSMLRAERAWRLMREHTDSEAGAAERFRRVAHFVEEELGCRARCGRLPAA